MVQWRPIQQCPHRFEKSRSLVPCERTERFQNAWHARSRCDQNESLFFSLLPHEIRRQIFEYALSGHVFMLQIGGLWVSNSKQFGELTGIRNKQTPINCTYERLLPFPGSNGALALPLTCHRAFEECVGLLYETNAFVARTGRSSHLPRIPKLIGAQMLRSIRRLQITYSGYKKSFNCEECHAYLESFWRATLMFEGLKDLRIFLDFVNALPIEGQLGPLQNQLVRLSHVPEMTLYLPPLAGCDLHSQFLRSKGSRVVVVPLPLGHWTLWPAFEEARIAELYGDPAKEKQFRRGDFCKECPDLAALTERL